jgi:hypothetical protein
MGKERTNRRRAFRHNLSLESPVGIVDEHSGFMSLGEEQTYRFVGTLMTFERRAHPIYLATRFPTASDVV